MYNVHCTYVYRNGLKKKMKKCHCKLHTHSSGVLKLFD